MNNKGFTLLELLIAMAIFATAGLAIMQASSSHLRAVSQLEDITVATMVAENQLQQQFLQRRWPPQELQQGETELANRQWVWRLRSSAAGDQDLRMLQIEVSLQQSQDDVLYQLQTYIGKPGI